MTAADLHGFGSSSGAQLSYRLFTVCVCVTTCTRLAKFCSARVQCVLAPQGTCGFFFFFWQAAPAVALYSSTDL
jgi:hypothetical protein